jgi:tetratricopeptide (TPR) repeat protein
LRWLGGWLIVWVALAGWRASILPLPPYGDSATRLFVEADWLAAHDFDYQRLWQVENSFSAGGPHAKASSVLPTVVALLFRAGLSQTAVQVVMHLANLGCAAALLVMMFAMLRPLAGKWGSVALVAAIVTTPLFSVQAEMLGLDLPMATFAVAAGLLALRGTFGWAAMATTISFAMKSTGIIATAAIWLYAASSLAVAYFSAYERRSPSRKGAHRWTDYVGFALLSASLVAQGLLIGWASSATRAADTVPRLTDYLGIADVLTLAPDVAALSTALAISTALVAFVGAGKLIRGTEMTGATTTAAPTIGLRVMSATLQRPELVLGSLVVLGTCLNVLLVARAPLPRNFTLAVPFLYVIAGSLWLRNTRWRSLAIGCLSLLVGVNLVNHAGVLYPPLQFWTRTAALRERSHEYRADLRGTIAALHKITTERQADEALIAADPFSLYLALPRLGYVEQPQPGYAVNAVSVSGWPGVARLFTDHPRRLIFFVADNFESRLGQITIPVPDRSLSAKAIVYDEYEKSSLVVYRRDLSAIAADGDVSSQHAALDRWYLEHLWFDRSLDRRPSISLVARAKALVGADCRPQAIELLRQGVVDKPDDLDLQLELARQLIEVGQVDEGLAYAHEVAWADDQRAAAFDILGLGRSQQGQFARALAEFQAALERDPDLDDARYHMALVYLRKNDAAQAESTLRDLLVRNPDYHDARQQLGMLALQSGKFDDAVREFDELLKRAPSRADAAFAAGGARLQQQRIPEAEQYFRTAIERQPNFAQAKSYLGLLHLDRGENEAAEQLFRQAIIDKPNYAEPYNNLGVVLGKTNRYAEAEEQFRAAIRHAPGYAEAYNNLGMLLAQNQQLPAARECFVQALQLNPNFQHAQQNLQQVDARLQGSKP